jgi:hypothetical protein
MKTCAQVSLEINELRKKLQENKLIVQFNETQKNYTQRNCDLKNPIFKCEMCNCWKKSKECYI